MRSVLSAVFADVKRSFFPRFDRPGRWKCRAGSFTTVDNEVGYCDDERRTIFVSRSVVHSRNADLLAEVLIHEITHAVLGDGSHGKRFIARLEAAVARAERFQRYSLADALRVEIHRYRAAERVTHATVYSELHDVVIEVRPASFAAAMRLLRRRYPRQLLDRCRRLRAEFHHAQKFLTAQDA